MKIEVAGLNMTSDQRKWLELVYDKFLKGIQYDERVLRTELWRDISPDFEPESIDRRLLRGGEITLLGILQLDPETKFLTLCDKIIATVRDLLIQNDSMNEVTAEELANQLGETTSDVGHALRLISHLGHFWSSASMHDSCVSSANVGHAYKEYFRYKGMDKLIADNCSEVTKPNMFSHPYHVSTPNAAVELDITTEIGSNSTLKPIFRTKVAEVDMKLCFVLMPFTEEWSSRVYTELIRPSVEGLGLQCLRADELNGQIVIEDIWAKINQCTFIIADVTNRNANVMYELGIVHTIGKPEILITQNLDKIPFDFTHLRHYGYSDNSTGFRDLTEKLSQVIPEMYNESYETDLRQLLAL